MDRLPRRLLAAWAVNPRRRGRPQLNLRNTMTESLQEVLDTQVSDNAPLIEWIDTARNPGSWSEIIDQWHKVQYELSLAGAEMSQ